MTKKNKINKSKKRKIKKANRLRPLLNLDLCACGPINCLVCEGDCRLAHTDKSGVVKCYELYRIDTSLVNISTKKEKHSKRKVNFSDEKTKRKHRLENRRQDKE